MTDKARELLERAYYVLGELSNAILKDSGEYNLAGDIYEFLSTPEPEQDEEPVAWMKEDEDGDLEFNTLNQFSCGRTNGIPLYLHPAPRKPFVRLSDEEIVSCWGVATEASAIVFARAIEDALEEKNK